MSSRSTTPLAFALVAVLALAGCGGGDTVDDAASPSITAPAPTPVEPVEPSESEEPELELPEFDDVDTSDWREANAQDGRGSLRVPPSWGWSWYYQSPAGIPEGQFVDLVTLNTGGRDMLALEDSVDPPSQCEGDGDAELLDLAELPAGDGLSLVALAVPSDRGVEFAAGIVDSELAESTCGLSFFNVDADLPYRVSTAPIVPSGDLDDHWVFGSVDEARDYVRGDEYESIRASLLSFQPPA